MSIWKKSRLDAILVLFTLLQAASILVMAYTFELMSLEVKVFCALFLAASIAYNIIVVTHLFTHSRWFANEWLNRVVSLINSMTAGQSVELYRLTHGRNHHRFNNDRKGSDGSTRDMTSTYRGGRNGEHIGPIKYAFGGAVQSLFGRAVEASAVWRLWRVGPNERIILLLASRREPRRSQELRQVQLERAVQSLSFVVFLAISWQWTLACYLPAYFVALVMVNVQNYYRHYGANPDLGCANAVSHYGRLYNWLAFNDGYHQEHHLSPSAHWSQLPSVRQSIGSAERIISPVPALVGFLDIRRKMLHRSESTVESIAAPLAAPGQEG